MDPKPFVVSDESVNSYGTRVLTAGIRLDRFKANPVGFFNHNTGGGWNPDPNYTGPIARWEDVKVAGKQLQASAVFDLNDPVGKAVGDKVANDFIRAASIGIIILKTSSDPADMVPGQTRPTITECELFEISVVDVPANQNALAFYDNENNRIELKDESDFERLQLGGIKTQKPADKTTKNPNTMKFSFLVEKFPALAALLKIEAPKEGEAKEVEIEVTAETLSAFEAETTRLKSELSTVTKRAEDAEAKVSELSAQIDTAKTEADKQKEESDKLGAEVKKLADELKKIDDNLKTLKIDANAGKDKGALNKGAEEAENEKEAAKAKREEFKKASKEAAKAKAAAEATA